MILVYLGRWSYGRFKDYNKIFYKMKNDLTTGTWQDNIWCPIIIILLCTSIVPLLNRTQKNGLEAQSPLPLDTMCKLSDAKIKQVKKIVGSILYYARAVDMTNGTQHNHQQNKWQELSAQWKRYYRFSIISLLTQMPLCVLERPTWLWISIPTGLTWQSPNPPAEHAGIFS